MKKKLILIILLFGLNVLCNSQNISEFNIDSISIGFDTLAVNITSLGKKGITKEVWEILKDESKDIYNRSEEATTCCVIEIDSIEYYAPILDEASGKERLIYNRLKKRRKIKVKASMIRIEYNINGVFKTYYMIDKFL